MRTRAMSAATNRRWSGIWPPLSATSIAESAAAAEEALHDPAVVCAPCLMTSDHDRELLLKLAREALAAHVGVAAAHVPGPAPILDHPGGAFVTLHNQGELRGCIGHIEPNEPLGKLVPRCAVAAGTTDPR